MINCSLKLQTFFFLPTQTHFLGQYLVIAGAVLLVLVQFLPDKESAQKLAHLFIAIALIAALLLGFKNNS